VKLVPELEGERGFRAFQVENDGAGRACHYEACIGPECVAGVCGQPPSTRFELACVRVVDAYKREWTKVARCSAPEDCRGESLGAYLTGLDECWRFGNADASRARVGELSRLWADLGCLEDFQLCPPAPEATCLDGRCVERPPAPVPIGWKRADLEGVFSIYLPPGVQDESNSRECSLTQTYAGNAIRVRTEYGEAYAYDDDAPTALAGARELRLGSRRARLVKRSFVREPDGAYWTLEVPDPPRAWRAWLYSDPHLTIDVSCATREGCAHAEIILGSVHLWDS
jgi:hypothetical protein